MQRKIKFRAYDSRSNDFYRPEDIAITLDGVLLNEDSDINGTGTTGYCQVYSLNVGYITLSQFAGLKDKNDKEIYEGDIVKARPYGDEKLEFISEVVFVNGGFTLGRKDQQLGGYDYIEVIGNIYENKELLK